jgi:hypothetical protein
MITAYQHGHRIYFNNGKWLYLDNNEPIAKERPCLNAAKCQHLRDMMHV